jgi:hypothetical protein
VLIAAFSVYSTWSTTDRATDSGSSVSIFLHIDIIIKLTHHSILITVLPISSRTGGGTNGAATGSPFDMGSLLGLFGGLGGGIVPPSTVPEGLWLCSDFSSVILL